VVLADLDRFKSVNDTYGHFAGDAVLREFTRRISAAMRPYDSIGRYGGEEFLIILPGCDERCTRNQAERMRASLANEPMMIGDAPHAVTCSFGATSWRPDAESTADELIHLADEALYIAKHQGRNCVAVLAPPNAEAVAQQKQT
jgi:diguanylate cyclase (GGDEF)-like protein